MSISKEIKSIKKEIEKAQLEIDQRILAKGVLKIQMRELENRKVDLEKQKYIYNPILLLGTERNLKCEYRARKDDGWWKTGTIIGRSSSKSAPYKIAHPTLHKWVAEVRVERAAYYEQVARWRKILEKELFSLEGEWVWIPQ